MRGKGSFLLEAHVLMGKMDNEHSKGIKTQHTIYWSLLQNPVMT